MPARMIRERIAARSEVWAFFEGLPLSLGQAAALAALASGLLVFVLMPRTSKWGSWTLGLLIPALISAVLYGILLRLAGIEFSDSRNSAWLFMVPWYLAGAVAAVAVVILRRRLRSWPSQASPASSL